jgi:hypothetical protein
MRTDDIIGRMIRPDCTPGGFAPTKTKRSSMYRDGLAVRKGATEFLKSRGLNSLDSQRGGMSSVR